MPKVSASKLHDACSTLLQEVQSSVDDARRAWIAAKGQAALASAGERAAHGALLAAIQRADDMRRSIGDLYASRDDLPELHLPTSATASHLNRDVLAEIFRELTAQWHHTRSGFELSTVRPPAFVAASVSRHWRSVALSTPAMWTKVRINFSPKTFTFLKDYLRMMLSRCRIVPINLLLQHPPPDHTWDYADEAALAEVLSCCCSVDVLIDDCDTSFRKSVLPLFQANMPMLRSFRFDDEQGHFSSARPISVEGLPGPGTRLLTACPLITTLAMSWIPFRLIDAQSMPQITSFTTRAQLTVEDVLTICLRWPHLAFLQADVVVDAPGFALGAGNTFDRLEVMMAGRGSILRVLNRTQTPQLRELTLSCMADDSYRYLASFLGHGACTTLRTLNLHKCYSGRICNVFQALPNLATLHLHALSSQGAHSLFTFWATPGLVHQPPQLRELRLTKCKFGDGARDMLVEFVSQRQTLPANTSSHLQKLHVSQKDNNIDNGEDIFPEWMAPRLAQLVTVVEIDTAIAAKLFAERDLMPE